MKRRNAWRIPNNPRKTEIPSTRTCEMSMKFKEKLTRNNKSWISQREKLKIWIGDDSFCTRLIFQIQSHNCFHFAIFFLLLFTEMFLFLSELFEFQIVTENFHLASVFPIFYGNKGKWPYPLRSHPYWIGFSLYSVGDWPYSIGTQSYCLGHRSQLQFHLYI